MPIGWSQVRVLELKKKCQTHHLMFSLKEKERLIAKNKEIFSMSLIMPPSKNKNIFLFQNLDGT